MKAVLLSGLAPLVFMAAWAAHGIVEPAAVLVKAEGEVLVQVANDDPRPGRVGDKLAAGDRVLPGSGARAVVVHRTGASQTITQAVTIESPSAGDDESDMFSRTVGVLARAADTDARAQPNRQGMIRPLPGQAVPVAPRNDLPVSQARPTLTWFSVPDSEGYRIHLWDGNGEMRTFETGTDTVWTFPAGELELAPGQRYEWTAAPLVSGRLSERHAFRTLDEDRHRALSEDLALLAEAGLDPSDDGLLLAAIIYRDYDLFYDAHQALRELEASGAEMSREALLLLGEVFDALGRLDDAEVAFDRADGVTQ
jgi:hypothetical protein